MLLFILNMRGSTRHIVLTFNRLFLLLFISCSSFGDPPSNVLVLLSSDSPTYQDALAGFKETFRHSIQTQILGGSKQSFAESPNIVVSFGRRAAEKASAMSATRIYCLDPGLVVAQGTQGGHQIVVSISPTPEALLSGLQK